MISPLTLSVREVEAGPNQETIGVWRTDQLFSMLDQFSAATLKRVDSERDAQFIVELAATPDPGVVTLLLRESIVVMASRQVGTTASVDAWESIASHFATMIDTAGECYVGPLASA